MADWNRNGEGYADQTAGMALQKIAREERKNAMAKKRSCRRTQEENAIHDKAVKIRKMTDRQLARYVEERVEKARSEGFSQGKAQTPKPEPVNIEKILGEIGNVRGIGTAKLLSIGAILDKYLEARENG